MKERRSIEVIKDGRPKKSSRSSAVIKNGRPKNVTIRVITTLIYVQQLPKSPIKGTICPFAKVRQKTTIKHYLYMKYIDWY